MKQTGQDVSICIRTQTVVDGEEETTELFTQGRYYEKNGSWYITYEETETTGYEGCRTTLRVQDHQVSLIRQGDYRSRLVVEENQRNIGYYATPVGELMIGVSAREVDNRLTPFGGTLEFSYALDLNASLLSDNRITIQVSLPEIDTQVNLQTGERTE